MGIKGMRSVTVGMAQANLTINLATVGNWIQP